ncbi:rho gdp-dissociation inhibitor 1 [Quercus suber]|uniref:Rho gdp-dissociation inhibitor 1 n=1 Tax=Quercus suber TaxID=58331 RepID=A0AAW0K0P4_QUESU
MQSLTILCPGQPDLILPIPFVDNSKRMLGTFSPQQEPYTSEMEETTPSGMFARGTYSARTKFVDDDGKCYLDMCYYFEIQKNWPKPS